jgi:hypothetical protein
VTFCKNLFSSTIGGDNTSTNSPTHLVAMRVPIFCSLSLTRSSADTDVDMLLNVFRTQGSSTFRASLGGLARRLPRYVPTTVHIPRPLSTSMTLRTAQTTASRQPGSTKEVEATKREEPKSVIYVANFPFWLEEQELRERFEVFGPILRVDIRVYLLHILRC